MEIDSKYKELTSHIIDLKTLLCSWICGKNECRPNFCKGNKILFAFRSISVAVDNCDTGDINYVYKLKKFYDSIQLFFEPVRNYKLYEFLSLRIATSLISGCMNIINKIHSNKKEFDNSNSEIENILKQIVSQFKSLVIFYYVFCSIEDVQGTETQKTKKILDYKVKFLLGNPKRKLKSSYNHNLFEIEKTKTIFTDISKHVEDLKLNFKNKKVSGLSFMEKIKACHDLAKILCSNVINIDEKKLELKTKDSQEIPSSIIEDKIDLSANNRVLTDKEIKNTLFQIYLKCKDETKQIYDFRSDYNKKLCYLWLTINKIIRFEYEGNNIKLKTINLMPTFYFFKYLVLEHKKNSKEDAISNEFKSFSRFIDLGKKMPCDLYLRKIKELYNCIQILFETKINFDLQNSKSYESLFKSFETSCCSTLIRSLKKIIGEIYKNKDELKKEIDNINDFIEFNLRRLEYVFVFFYVAKEFGFITSSETIKSIDRISKFFSGTTSPKGHHYYFYSYDVFSRYKQPENYFTKDFFDLVKKKTEEIKTSSQKINKKSLEEKIKLCDDVIKELNKTYKFLDNNSYDDKFSKFYFNVEQIKEKQTCDNENMILNKSNEFFIILNDKNKDESEFYKTDLNLQSDCADISIKSLKDVIINFRKGGISKYFLEETLKNYDKLINRAYMENNLNLDVITDVLNIFFSFCGGNDKNKKPIYHDFDVSTNFRFMVTYMRIFELAYEFKQHECGNKSVKVINFDQHRKQFVNILKCCTLTKTSQHSVTIHQIASGFGFLVDQNKNPNLDYWFLNTRRELFMAEEELLNSLKEIYQKIGKYKPGSGTKYEKNNKKENIIRLEKNLDRKKLLAIVSTTLKLINESYLKNKLDYKLIKRYFDLLLIVSKGSMYKHFNKQENEIFIRAFKRLIELIYEIKKTDVQNNTFDCITPEALKEHIQHYKNMIRCFFKSEAVEDLSIHELKRYRALINPLIDKKLKSGGYWFLKERYELFDIEATKDEFKGYHDKIKTELEKRRKEKDISLFSSSEEKDYKDSLVEEEDEKYKLEIKYNTQKRIKDGIKNNDTINGKSDIDIESKKNNCFSSDEEYQPYEKDNKCTQKVKCNTRKKKENNIKNKKEAIKKLHMNCKSVIKIKQEDEDKKHDYISLNEEEDDELFKIEEKYNSTKWPRAKNKTNNTENTKSDLDSEFEKSTDKKVINKKRKGEPLCNKNINKEIINYIGSVPGDGNCLLYSILCQIAQKEFDRLVNYVKENDMIYNEFKSKFWCEDYEFELDDIFPNFLGVIEEYRADNKTKFSRQANLIRSAIVIKCIEDFLRGIAQNKNIENYETMSLKELIKKIDAIEMNLEMVENLISNFGKDMNIEYEDAENKKVCSMNTRGSFIFDDYFDVFKSISDLLNRPVFVYKDKITADEKEEYIFKRPIMHEKNLMKVDKSLIESEYVSQDDKNRYKDYFKAEITKLGSDYILLYFSESHISPCGLNKNGKIYSYKDIDIEINNPKQKTKNKIKIETSTSSLREKSKKCNTTKNNKVPRLISSKDGIINFNK